MAYDYDKLYAETRDALGPPTQAIVDAFADLAPGTVLDVGCGQGRDAIFLARAGHQVTAVDISPAGVRDVRRVAKAEGLGIATEVCDVRQFEPRSDFDVVLIDRTLHMLSAADQTSVLTRLIGHVAPDGWLLIADETRNLPRFRAILDAAPHDWTITRDGRGYLFAQRSQRVAASRVP